MEDSTLTMRTFLKNVSESEYISIKDLTAFLEVEPEASEKFVKWVGIRVPVARQLAYADLLRSDWYIKYLSGYPVNWHVQWEVMFAMKELNERKA